VTEQRDVFSDLVAEADIVDRMVAELDESRWALPTPAPGWTVAHQIAHLSFIFRLAGLAATEPATFTAVTAAASADFEGAVNAAFAGYPLDSPEALFGRWRDERDQAIKALAAVPANEVVPWLVRPLPPAVLACAGFMEVFGHGQDIADALGVEREATDRLAHLVWFATAVWDFGYQARGLTPPDTQFRFEITAPSGELWTFGPADAAQKISGPALDFCLLVTRRRHRDDLALVAAGPDADDWLDIAQAYRGPAGPGRVSGQFDKE
jgi:enediyne biosynthesis protein E11